MMVMVVVSALCDCYRDSKKCLYCTVGAGTIMTVGKAHFWFTLVKGKT